MAMRTHTLFMMGIVLAACNDGDPDPIVTVPKLTTAEDASVTGQVDARDGDGNVLAFELGTPQHGSVTQANNVVTYTPAANYNGTDSILVHVSDGMKTADATIEITVTPVNDPPVAGAVSLAAKEDMPLVTAQAMLIGAASDLDGDSLTISGVRNAMHGMVAITGSDVTFIPDPEFSGAASYEFMVSDGKATSLATVSIAVGGLNDPPVAIGDTATTLPDMPLVIPAADLAKNDTDVEGQTLAVTEVSNPVNGMVELKDGAVTFTPGQHFIGIATFDYKVSDGADTAVGQVTVTVDHPPAVVDDSDTTPEDMPLVVPAADLANNDTDVDGQTLTVTQVSNPTHGTVELKDGTVTFTPDANFNGDATFDYQVSDGIATAVGHATVTVMPVNDPPGAVADALTGTVDTTQMIPGTILTTNDTDIDSDPKMLAVAAVDKGNHCTVTVSDGVVTFIPEAGFTGDATFEYTVSDGTDTATGQVTVTVSAPAR